MASTNISSLANTLAQAQIKINFWVSFINLAFGVTGNFLNVLLFSRRKLRTISCCTYFFGSSMAMFLLLPIASGTAMYATFYPHPISYISRFCKFWLYIHPALAMMYRWMLAAACLDRYALSSTNARLRRFATVRIAHRVIAAIVIMWFILPCYLLVFVDIKAGNCIIVAGYAAALYNGIFTIVNTYVIPISVMTIGTILIGRNLAKKRERHQAVGEQQQGSNKKQRVERSRDQQALVMLFGQIIVYAILTAPWTIYSVYSAIVLNVQNKSADRLAIEHFLSYLVGQICLLFPTSSFYLYTLTSNMFRKEFYVMINSILCCRWNVKNDRMESTTDHVSSKTPVIQ